MNAVFVGFHSLNDESAIFTDDQRRALEAIVAERDVAASRIDAIIDGIEDDVRDALLLKNAPNGCDPSAVWQELQAIGSQIKTLRDGFTHLSPSAKATLQMTHRARNRKGRLTMNEVLCLAAAIGATVVEVVDSLERPRPKKKSKEHLRRAVQSLQFIWFDLTKKWPVKTAQKKIRDNRRDRMVPTAFGRFVEVALSPLNETMRIESFGNYCTKQPMGSKFPPQKQQE